jgi:serine/threonine-protein kinase
MPLATGTKLGPYEIRAPIGAGGMGEVYRAHDPRMGRDVAIKISAERFSDRFSREVHAVAALNHPNICQLYDVGSDYLVMELVEGTTLSERIRQGAVALDEALKIARQIADALEDAHKKGIIHRDLKPGNIILRPDGTVKVLDFGLAKVTDKTPSGAFEHSQSPTLDPVSRVGMVVGTAAYMPPEQARGKLVDKRADIWAFGVILYEMLTGERPFAGETVSDTLIEVATREPDWERIPAQARRLLRRCLEKDPKRRLRDIGDAWFWLEDAGEEAVASAKRAAGDCRPPLPPSPACWPPPSPPAITRVNFRMPALSGFPLRRRSRRMPSTWLSRRTGRASIHRASTKTTISGSVPSTPQTPKNCPVRKEL